MSLPCAYKMHDCIANNEVLQLNDIHSHWHLPTVPLIALSLIVPLFATSSLAALSFTAPSLIAQPFIATPFVRQPAVLEPAIVIGKGRPSLLLSRISRGAKSRQPQNSTRRNPSAFERPIRKSQAQAKPIKRTDKGKQ